MDKEEAASIKNARKYFADISLAANLVFIKSKFILISDTMTSFKAKKISLSVSI
jgi:hypothetical protein